MTPDTSDLQHRLPPPPAAVTQEAAPDPPSTGALLNNKEAGTYRCVVCGAALF
jgi:peptide-methionine (R)-S-oxide reductase